MLIFTFPVTIVTSPITKTSFWDRFWAFLCNLWCNLNLSCLYIIILLHSKKVILYIIFKIGHKSSLEVSQIPAMKPTVFAGWTEPARHISSLFTSLTSSCRAPYFTLQLDRWSSTSPSSGSLFSPTCEHRRNSKTNFALTCCSKTWVIVGRHIQHVIVTLGGCFIASFILEFNRDLEKQREGAASNIAKKKQEAEASVSIWLAYMFKSAALNEEIRGSSVKGLRWEEIRR